MDLSPAIRPQGYQLEEAETVRQRDAESVDQVRHVVGTEVAKNVYVLKIQRDHQTRHVCEPREVSVRQAWPDSNEAQADLDGSTDGSCAHYLV